MTNLLYIDSSKYSYDTKDRENQTNNTTIDSYNNCVILDSPQKSTIGTFIRLLTVITKIVNNNINIEVHCLDSKYNNVLLQNINN